MKKTILLAVIALFGCDQKHIDLTSCRFAAAKMPTERGVIIAYRTCDKVYSAEAEKEKAALEKASVSPFDQFVKEPWERDWSRAPAPQANKQ